MPIEISKNKVLVITSRFPYLPGEYFFESEIKEWLLREDLSIKILPINRSAHSVLRSGYSHLEIVEAYSRPNFWERCSLLKKVCFSKDLYVELYNLFGQKKIFSPRVLIRLLKSLYLFQQARIKFEAAYKNNPSYFHSLDLIYCYWNDFASLAIISFLKDKGVKAKLISRLHGGDLYEERFEGNYFPIKRQYIYLFDELHFLSQSALNYGKSRYSLVDDLCKVSPLGVKVDKNLKFSNVKNYNEVMIISISNLIRLKRVDLIIQAIKEFWASHYSPNNIKWVHIGSGPMQADLINLAEKEFANTNVNFSFLGSMDNNDVLELLRSSPIDIFISASEFEGVPVSIMEAMSFGIPVVATNVGAVSDLVSKNTGYLAKADASAVELAMGMKDVLARNINCELSKNAYHHILKHFNAELNHNEFISKVVS